MVVKRDDEVAPLGDRPLDVNSTEIVQMMSFGDQMINESYSPTKIVGKTRNFAEKTGSYT